MADWTHVSAVVRYQAWCPRSGCMFTWESAAEDEARGAARNHDRRHCPSCDRRMLRHGGMCAVCKVLEDADA